MAINFPDTPALNQQFTVGASTWQWDGTAWNIVPQMAPVNGMDTPPVNPVVGQMWWRSSNGQLYIYYDDGNSKQWVMTSPGLYQQTKTARQHNLVVNPAMAVSQEQGTTAVTASAMYPADQWQHVFTGPVCSTQNVASLTPDNSPNRLRKTVTTQKASLAAGDYSVFRQPIEGSRISVLGYGSAQAIQAVLRFGFKGPAGTYSFRLANDVPNRCYIKNFTVAAGQANTDTLQVFTIPPDTTGTWGTGGSLGMYFDICDACGTSFQGVEGWQAGGLLGTSNNNNMVSTNGNIVELFDVGLYPDPDRTGLAPPFQAPMFSDALATCMRYYEQMYVRGVAYASSGVAVQRCQGFYKVQKRIVPTGNVVVLGGALTAPSVQGSSVWEAWVGYNAAGASNEGQFTVTGNARM